MVYSSRPLYVKRTKAVTWRQELKQKPWMMRTDLLGLFSYTTQGQLMRSGTVQSVLGSPTSVVNRDNAPSD